jgi:1,4-dihydroxy-2-naphthoate octaprenyltransferase
MALLTTVCLQVLSNISNEVGDLEKGTDNANRLGPIRSAQSGKLSLLQLKNAMVFFVALSVVFGMLLIYASFATFLCMPAVSMLVMGAGAIVASIKYTYGKKSYGYIGLGDLFVFVFFGLVSVLGVYFLATGRFEIIYLLPASAIGMLSTGVLNVNNLRDVDNDANFNKRTLVVRFGTGIMKLYHTILILGALLLMLVFNILEELAPISYLFLLSTPLFVWHLYKIHSCVGRDLDPQLKVLSITSLLLSILFSIGLLYVK